MYIENKPTRIIEYGCGKIDTTTIAQIAAKTPVFMSLLITLSF